MITLVMAVFAYCNLTCCFACLGLFCNLIALLMAHGSWLNMARWASCDTPEKTYKWASMDKPGHLVPRFLHPLVVEVQSGLSPVSSLRPPKSTP
ncbi:hypothetical protein V8C86DRAFT_2799779 [Haematococcus lacustris]